MYITSGQQDTEKSDWATRYRKKHHYAENG